MDFTRVYSIDKDGDVIEFNDIPNADGIYLTIWRVMFDLYQDYFIDKIEKPEWFTDGFISFSELQMIGDMKPFWDLIHDERVPLEHRLVFGFTFDSVTVEGNFPKIIEALEAFIKIMTTEYAEFFSEINFDTLTELVDTLKELSEDDDYVGAAIKNSTVSGIWDKYDEDGEWSPYNVIKGKQHNNLIDIIK